MKRKDITILNIADYIRQERRKLIEKNAVKMLDGQRFYWNKREWKILKEYCAILDYKSKEGMRFLGASHFKSNKII